jgi:asparagine synthase (glutamine-hydrolysing)
MCGIAGICQLDREALPPQSVQWVKAMSAALAHRGPDDQGCWQGTRACFGHRRLSIIDLSGGGQPMSTADRSLTIVTNGEIYNFAALRAELEKSGARFWSQSDTEVILEAYRLWGTDCLQHLEGMFAFALWDERQQRLFCARDRFGKKPFFYTIQQGQFFFASQINALEQVPDLQLTVDPKAIMRYLAYEYVPTPETIYKEVHSLQPAHFLLLENNDLQCCRYWDMPWPDENDRRPIQTLCEELRFLLDRAVQRRMISDVPLGVFLSGGIDSSIVTGLMASHSVTPVRSFSIAFQEASYDESPYARIVAEAFATEHQEAQLAAHECADSLPMLVSRMDVPMADASLAPTYFLSGITREHVAVALGGDGADELWAGYEHYIAFQLAQYYNHIPKILRKALIEPLCRLLPGSAGYINPRLAVQTFLRAAHAPAWQRVQTMLTALTPDMQKSILDTAIQQENAAFLEPETLFAPTREHYEHWQPAELASPLARAFHVYVRQFLLDDILVKVDRCSMLHSLEVRAPFLDRDVAEFTARLPLRHKLHHFQRKWLLKKAFADLLPPQILRRNKRGFQIPVSQWLRERLRPLLEDMLAPETLKKQGIFQAQAVQELIRQHMSGQADLRKPLWTLLVFQLWWQAHRKGRSSCL